MRPPSGLRARNFLGAQSAAAARRRRSHSDSAASKPKPAPKAKTAPESQLRERFRPAQLEQPLRHRNPNDHEDRCAREAMKRSRSVAFAETASTTPKNPSMTRLWSGTTVASEARVQCLVERRRVTRSRSPSGSVEWHPCPCRQPPSLRAAYPSAQRGSYVRWPIPAGP